MEKTIINTNTKEGQLMARCLITDVVGNHHHKANEPMWLPDCTTLDTLYDCIADKLNGLSLYKAYTYVNLLVNQAISYWKKSKGRFLHLVNQLKGSVLDLLNEKNEGYYPKAYLLYGYRSPNLRMVIKLRDIVYNYLWAIIYNDISGEEVIALADDIKSVIEGIKKEKLVIESSTKIYLYTDKEIELKWVNLIIDECTKDFNLITSPKAVKELSEDCISDIFLSLMDRFNISSSYLLDRISYLSRYFEEREDEGEDYESITGTICVNGDEMEAEVYILDGKVHIDVPYSNVDIMNGIVVGCNA